MQRKLILLFVFTICCGINGIAQCVAPKVSVHAISFLPEMNGAPLILDAKSYAIPGTGDSLRISTLRFYISGILLLQDTALVWAEQNSYHLIDAAEPERMKIMLPLPSGLLYNKVRFNLGIDSITNTRGAQGGDLDAVRGMYWAWQSGYINIKLEGTSPVCNTRKHEFQYHLGGYGAGTYCMQPVVLGANSKKDLCIGIALDRFFLELPLAAQPSVMIPGSDAVALARKAALMFYPIKQR